MISSVILFVVLAEVAFAQKNATANLLLPADDGTNLAASVISANSKATAYVVDCNFPSAPPGATAKVKRQASAAATTTVTGGDDNDGGGGGDSFTECPFPTPVTITQGASTLHFAYQLEGSSQTVDCKRFGTTKAICTGTANGPSIEDPGTTTATLVGTDLPTAIEIEITAGASKLSASSSKSSASSSSNSASMTEPPTTTEAGSGSGSQTSGAPASATSSAMAVQPLARILVVFVAGLTAASLLLL